MYIFTSGVHRRRHAKLIKPTGYNETWRLLLISGKCGQTGSCHAGLRGPSAWWERNSGWRGARKGRCAAEFTFIQYSVRSEKTYGGHRKNRFQLGQHRNFVVFLYFFFFLWKNSSFVGILTKRVRIFIFWWEFQFFTRGPNSVPNRKGKTSRVLWSVRSCFKTQ